MRYPSDDPPCAAMRIGAVVAASEGVTAHGIDGGEAEECAIRHVAASEGLCYEAAHSHGDGACCAASPQATSAAAGGTLAIRCVSMEACAVCAEWGA